LSVTSRYHTDNLTNNEIEALNKVAFEKGWQNTLETIIRANYPAVYNAIVDEKRSDFRLFLPIKKNSRVLSVESDWGSIPFKVAYNCKKIISVESAFEKAHFNKIRCVQEGIENLKVIVASITKLPFLENSFDIVIINNLLKLLVSSKEVNDPKEFQAVFLHDLKKLLRPGGCVYLGLENSLGAYFYNKTSDSLKSRSKIGSEYQAYAYSYWGYKRLFRKAGFSEIQLLSPRPSAERAYSLFSAENAQIVKFYLKIMQAQKQATFTRKVKLICGNVGIHLGLWKFLSPYYSIIIKKPEVKNAS